MQVVALVSWIVTALAGLYLFAIWLIEYDPDYQTAAETRLPIPVIAGHVGLALVGLGFWVGYLATGNDHFAWTALGLLAAVVTFGLTMAVRWFGVYRSRTGTVMLAGAGGAGRADQQLSVPPERHFPVSVVIAHGLFAVVTVVLVLLSNLGVGGG